MGTSDPASQLVAARTALKLLVAAGYVSAEKANDAMSIAHGFRKGPLPPAPAEAQAQGGGEVVAWHIEHPDGFVSLRKPDAVDSHMREVAAADEIRIRPLVYGDTAPPSAPVGVDAMGRAMDAYRAACAEWRKNPDNRDEPEAMHGVRAVVAAIAQQPAAREEMSPEFTDSARAAIAWVLYHHQGGSSPVGQPLRFALGMGADEQLPDWRIAEAKRWAELAGATTADFHRQQPAAVDGAVGTVTRVGEFEVQEHRIELDPEFDERLNNMPAGTVVRLYAAPLRDLTQKHLADAAAALATQPGDAE